MRRRLFAWMVENLGEKHNRDLEPYKRALFADLRGTIVEIGAGGGVNLPYLSSGVRWIGVEPNPWFAPYAERRAKSAGVGIELQAGHAESLPFASKSVDAVISTLVLCSVRDQAAVLAEVRRILKPGGRFAFIEHVVADSDSPFYRKQKFARPFCGFLCDGCDPMRDTTRAIESAGFANLRLSRFHVPAIPIFPHIEGVATA